PGHILVYAPRSSSLCRLATDRMILSIPIRVILQSAAVLAALNKPGHILMYAPRFLSFAALLQIE
uniref:hypothetical protein n=1 Tax=Klebsiella variicola TaxID=244366 RepID=UPI002B05B76F